MHVRFEADRPDEWTAPARVVLASEKADVALLELTGPVPPGVHAAGTEPPAYGAVPDTDELLPCSALGFPRFKLREDRMRRLDDGSPSSTATPATPPDDLGAVQPPRRHPRTRGHSTGVGPRTRPLPLGGHVRCGGLARRTLIGLVSAHHRSDGLGRLAAVRVDRWYELLPRATSPCCTGTPDCPRHHPSRPPSHPAPRAPAAWRTCRTTCRCGNSTHW
ncbi:hypothetical protein StrepF001_13380 [Streptomyces sp. F001]|uniref:hypothetical protein n=1 Tax=Streptomyces sp. F001 TaxID=1510026 RepID=UPI00101E2FD5|nr:hypothetical protein [Streptomyces sp. F001]RZB18138.1 hypothetical protein StrepF001_13380 [Streptomyces sp. F001]